MYVVFRARSLQSGYTGAVQKLLGGQATMYTNTNDLGLGSNQSTFRKMLVDLKNMKILAVDPSWGNGTSLSKMIEMCPDKDDPPQ